MRTITLSAIALLLGTINSLAQTVATFDDLTLPRVDTYYVNYTASGTDVGFNDGLAHFPCVYDTSSFGNYWNFGFSYSNMTDSVTSGYTNQYAAKTAIGYGGSANYAVAYCYNPVNNQNSVMVYLRSAAIGYSVEGFYVTNNTYAYNSMKNGDAFESKFIHGDWFKLTVKGYHGGAITADSVNFYLADFLHSDTDSNYIVNTWQWVDLLPLGHVDSLLFSLTSSATGASGMNTPAYFCMDNFITNETDLAINNIPTTAAAKIYPIPARNHLFIDVSDDNIQKMVIRNALGQEVYNCKITTKITEVNTSLLSPGTYIIELHSPNKTATSRFIKE